jgi:hypothetical protein
MPDEKLYPCRDSKYDGCPSDVQKEGDLCESCKEYHKDMQETNMTEIVNKYNSWLNEQKSKS